MVKDYAFELVDVPAQSEYLEVRYSVSIKLDHVRLLTVIIFIGSDL